MSPEAIAARMPAGITNLYTMIGSPITQVKSPALYNSYFEANGIDATMVPFDLPDSGVNAFFEMMRVTPNFQGGIVTVPHKQAAARCMDELTTRAQQLSTVNVVRRDDDRLIGDMVDGLGFLVAVAHHDLQVKDTRVAVIGAGGAGGAIIQALAEAKAARIVVHEIRRERHAVIEHVAKEVYPAVAIAFELNDLKGFDLVVNASPVGMNGDPKLPYPTESLEHDTLVADVVTEPRETPWLAAASRAGCDVLYGAEMVFGQFGLMARHMGLDIPDPVDSSRVP